MMMSMSLRLLNRVQPCIQRQSQKTTINSMNNINMNMNMNIIRSKSSKSTSNSNSNSGILRKASMALGKQNNSSNTSTANVTVNEKLTNNRHKLRRDPVLKVTPAATATATVDQYEEAMQGQMDPQQQMEQQTTGSGSGSGSVPTYTEMQQAYTSPPPPPPVIPEPPSPSAFSRTEFHQGHLHEFAPRIVVVGVGGGGGNAVNNMIANQLSGVDFLALNTDAQHLSTTLTSNRLQIGTNLTSGLGCGANPDAGRLAAEESRDEITELLGDAHMVFVTAGMGGGTGTGAAPVVAEVCYNLGILTVGVVTKPFRFEGTHRMRLANEGISRLESVVDTLIMIPNQNLFQLANDQTSFMDSFAMADNVLLAGVKSITDLMTTPGLINLDFADVQSVMHGMGNAMLGTGVAGRDDCVNEGDERAIMAAEMALANPLLGDNMDIGTAKGMLVNITGGKDMTLFEVDRAAQRITERVVDENANIIFGSAYDESLDGSIRVSVVATGIDEKIN